MRLVSQVGVNGFLTGAVQVYQESTGYGAVCNVGFGATDAAVVCSQAGLPGPAYVLTDPFGVAGAATPRDAQPDPAELAVRMHGQPSSIVKCAQSPPKRIVAWIVGSVAVLK